MPLTTEDEIQTLNSDVKIEVIDIQLPELYNLFQDPLNVFDKQDKMTDEDKVCVQPQSDQEIRKIDEDWLKAQFYKVNQGKGLEDFKFDQLYK